MPLWVTAIAIAVLGTMAWGGVLAAPWLPLPRREVDRLLALVQPKPGELLCDLGCGDGRILTQAALRYGVRGVGFEVSLLPYVLCWCRIIASRTWRTVKVRYRNFYTQPLGQFTVVTAFLTPRAMAKLGPKLAAELTPGSRVVSYSFPIPGWQPQAVSKPNASHVAIYRYDIATVKTVAGGRDFRELGSSSAAGSQGRN